MSANAWASRSDFLLALLVVYIYLVDDRSVSGAILTSGPFAIGQRSGMAFAIAAAT